MYTYSLKMQEVSEFDLTNGMLFTSMGLGLSFFFKLLIKQMRLEGGCISFLSGAGAKPDGHRVELGCTDFHLHQGQSNALKGFQRCSLHF